MRCLPFATILVAAMTSAAAAQPAAKAPPAASNPVVASNPSEAFGEKFRMNKVGDYVPNGNFDGDLRIVTELPQPFHLHIGAAHATAENFAHLATIKSLDRLSIGPEPIAAKQLKGLVAFRGRPRILALVVDDATLKFLADNGLVHLLGGTEGLPKNPKIPNGAKSDDELIGLILRDVTIGATGLESLSRLPRLESLSLDRSTITDDEATVLAKLKTLVKLDLAATKITDAALERLSQLPQLTTLDLAKTGITAAGLKGLPKFKSLKTLRIDLSDDALATLSSLGLLHVLDAADGPQSGRVATDDQIVAIRLTGNVADAGLRKLIGVIAPTKLDLYGSQVTPAALADLGRLGKISELSLDEKQSTDEGLAHVAKLPELAELNVTLTDVSLPALVRHKLLHLAGRHNMKNVDDERPMSLEEIVKVRVGRQLGSAGFAALAAAPNLAEIDFLGRPFTGEDAKAVAAMKNLKKLRLASAPLTDEGLQGLIAGQKLHVLATALAAPETQATADDQIRTLTLQSVRLTDAGLAPLAKLKNLEQLSIRANKVTPAGRQALQAELPKCRVDFQN